MLKRLLTLFTHRIYSLPILVLMPHSRCNCRCVMCDIWKANHDKREISAEDLQRHMDSFLQIGVKEVVLSGGEALMHSNLWRLCNELNRNKIRVTLLSTGLLLAKNAGEVINACDEVIVSLDGSMKVHDEIRNIPNAFAKLDEGVRALKTRRKDYKVSARCVLQRHNFFDFINTVKAARSMGLDRISFLAADVSTAAFNHVDGLSRERIGDVALNKEETLRFEEIIHRSFDVLRDDYASRFIAERPTKMTRIVQYYKALNGMGEFPPPVCNAPWVSAVIESDGRVLPCFFHKAYGNIHEKKFLDIINSGEAITFRKKLDMNTDETCKKCVCSLKVGIAQFN